MTLWVWLVYFLTHWGRVTHLCVSKLTIIGSDNGLSPDRRQAIIWTNAGISIGRLGTIKITAEWTSWQMKLMFVHLWDVAVGYREKSWPWIILQYHRYNHSITVTTNERRGDPNHQLLSCLSNSLFRLTSKETWQVRVTNLCEGNPPVTGCFPDKGASYAENAYMW